MQYTRFDSTQHSFSLFFRRQLFFNTETYSLLWFVLIFMFMDSRFLFNFISFNLFSKLIERFPVFLIHHNIINFINLMTKTMFSPKEKLFVRQNFILFVIIAKFFTKDYVINLRQTILFIYLFDLRYILSYF